jgi:hypothetical protein
MARSHPLRVREPCGLITALIQLFGRFDINRLEELHNNSARMTSRNLGRLRNGAYRSSSDEQVDGQHGWR